MDEPIRKIIQIIETHHDGLMALCNDGTLWQMGEATSFQWEDFKAVPQPGEDK